MWSLIRQLPALVCLLALLNLPLSADDVTEGEAAESGLTVRDVCILLQVRNENRYSHNVTLTSSLPGGINTRRPAFRIGEDGKKPGPQPLGIITFEGQAEKDVEVGLQLVTGRHYAHWPPAQVRSTRILWPSLDLTKESERNSLVPDSHWLTPLRDSNRLSISASKVFKVSERFLLYDLSLKRTNNLSVVVDGDQYTITAQGKSPIHNVTLFRPLGDGKWNVASLATLESRQAKARPKKPDDPEEAETATDAESDVFDATEVCPFAADTGDEEETTEEPTEETPVESEDSETESTTDPSEPEGTPFPLTLEGVSAEQALAPIIEQMSELGLGDVETAYIAAVLREHAVIENQAIFVYRLDPTTFEEMLPIDVLPPPTKIVRVPLVIVRGLDPHISDEVDQLITQMGAALWKDRNAAQARLLDIGPAAVPKLKAALKHNDMEIVFRTEQLLELLEGNPEEAVGLNPFGGGAGFF